MAIKSERTGKTRRKTGWCEIPDSTKESIESNIVHMRDVEKQSWKYISNTVKGLTGIELTESYLYNVYQRKKGRDLRQKVKEERAIIIVRVYLRTHSIVQTAKECGVTNYSVKMALKDKGLVKIEKLKLKALAKQLVGLPLE